MRGAPSRTPSRARLLPPDITDFTGRCAELAALTDPASFPPHAAALFVVTGAGGTGKTALAVRAARLAGDAFPDAHLYADLGGYTGCPTPVPDVLRRFLRALGAEGPLPEDQDELVGMFRTALAGQRCLVVLDDAVDEAQVRPLLPSGPDALVIVTSRNWLGGLAGAVPLRLTPMSEGEAAAMLAKVLGPRWTGAGDSEVVDAAVDSELVDSQVESQYYSETSENRELPDFSADEDAKALLALCGHLPLAIRIAAARLLSRPQMGIDDLCEQLRDERRRLRRLQAGDITVNGVLESSYDALEPGDQLVFRRLALLRGHDFCAEAVAAVAGIAREEAQEALDRMADRSVVRAESPSGRYSLHSLARLFAAERLAADEDSETSQAAEDRHLDWLLGRLRVAADLVNPYMVRLPAARTGVTNGDESEMGVGAGLGESNEGTEPGVISSEEQFGQLALMVPAPSDVHSGLHSDDAPRALPHREAALAWLDAERRNLLALVRHHRRTGDSMVCWTVPDELRGYYHARRHLREWTRMAAIGLAAARAAADLRAQAAMHLSLGMAEYAASRFDEAEDHYHRTVELGLGAGWREGEAAGYRNLAGVALALGDTATSEKYLSLWADLHEALDIPLGSGKRGTCADRADGDGASLAIGPAVNADTWNRLSRREQTVARLVVQGLTNQQIAKRIRCSPETVKFHLRNIFRKLDIGSRVEIARFVLSAAGRA